MRVNRQTPHLLFELFLPYLSGQENSTGVNRRSPLAEIVHIHVPERDASNPSGRLLTLMNPAYMIRQMMEHYSSLYNLGERITGLRYFRQETAPDAWASRSLLSFAAGRDEAMEFTNMGGKSFYNKQGGTNENYSQL